MLGLHFVPKGLIADVLLPTSLTVASVEIMTNLSILREKRWTNFLENGDLPSRLTQPHILQRTDMKKERAVGLQDLA